MHALKTLPDKLYVACSGGIDSTVLAHFAVECRRDVTLAFFHHGNEYADIEHQFVSSVSRSLNVPLVVGLMDRPLTGSREKAWRDARYAWFRQLPAPVAVGTTLDDAVEWYIMTCLQGEGHFMQYQSANCIKPLLATSKAAIKQYAEQNSIHHLEDASNADINFAVRNRVRHTIIPPCIEVQPGLFNIVRKRICEKTHMRSPVDGC